MAKSSPRARIRIRREARRRYGIDAACHEINTERVWGEGGADGMMPSLSGSARELDALKTE